MKVSLSVNLPEKAPVATTGASVVLARLAADLAAGVFTALFASIVTGMFGLRLETTSLL